MHSLILLCNSYNYYFYELTGNFSSKFEEFANQLWKTFGRDYIIPDNLAQYAEEYFEEKSAFNHEDNPLAKFALQCLPEPGKSTFVYLIESNSNY